MTSIKTDHQIFNKLLEYESIFKHYGVETQSQYESSEDERNDDLIRDNEHYLKRIRNIFERNENNKEKKIDAKTMNKKSTKVTTQNSQKKFKQSKKLEKQTKNQDNVLKIKVPNTVQSRKSSHTDNKQKLNTNVKNSKPVSSIPEISLHVPSSSTTDTTHKFKTVESKSDQSISNIQSRSSLIPPTFSSSQTSVSEHSPTTNSSIHERNPSVTTKPLTDSKSIWDLDEINRFTYEIFKYNNGDHNKSLIRPDRIRLNCATDQDENLQNYIQSRLHCLDVFEEYVNSLKRQHGFIQNASSDPPLFDPGVSITGPQVKNDATVLDKEDSAIIKKLINIEPRKKYALVHEQIGIFIIGGYNLYVDVPIQKEPTTDYLFKFNGEIVKIPPLTPCRVHFAIYTDGDAIYIAGGQTIHNELLDDIQRFDFKTLKWEYIATLTNPIAACGMTLDDKRIYLIGGYDIVQNVTTFLADYTIYNMATGQFEKSTDLPSPRCRSLVFATNKAIFCVSGLIEGRNENNNKKTKISNDILKWTEKMPLWIKVSQTPELTKFHALSFTDPYLEITKRILNAKGDETDNIPEAYYDFRTNLWTNGKAPTSSESSKTIQPEVKSRLAKSSTKSKARTSSKPSNKTKTSSKNKSKK